MMRLHLENEAACTLAVEEVSPDEVYRYGIVKPMGDLPASGAFMWHLPIIISSQQVVKSVEALFSLS